MKDTSESAFPISGIITTDRDNVPVGFDLAGGMTLRDAFAVAALQGMNADSIRNANMGININDDAREAAMNARWAYLQADAMLAEREKDA